MEGMVTERAGAAVAPLDALAQLASQLQQRVGVLGLELDASWRELYFARWPVLRMVTDAALLGELFSSLFLRECEVMPSIATLAAPAGRLVLLPGDAVHRSLTALAIACRPGVLRCCIDREVRTVMEAALGPYFAPLLACSERGRPVSAEAAGWSPLHWACLGYVDWVSLLQRGDRLLRRIVQLSLPVGMLSMHKRRRAARREVKPEDAVRLLRECEAGWPC